MKQAFERIMAEDLYEHICARRYERTPVRSGHRNGYRGRGLLTSVGLIRLDVPRDRAGGYEPGCFERYKRVCGVVDEGIRAMFLRGVSTRKVGNVLDCLCGEGVSASYVSEVTKALDDEVKAFENRPIEDDFAFLFLDGLDVKMRMELKVKRYRILIAYGIRRDGSRSFISFRLAPHEGSGTWRSFLENLKVRGLAGHNLQLIIMDGCPGLWSAIEEVFALVPHQLCWVHKLRNIAKYCPKRYREECTSQAAKIMYAKTATMAAKLFRQWKARWIKLIPKAVECLEKDFHKLIPFFEFSQKFHKVIRTTNVIERSFKEIRRRLKVMGYFQNTKSCKRIVLSSFLYFNQKWERKTERIVPIAQYFSTTRKLNLIKQPEIKAALA
ncbi:MAG: IS256 family transposase [Proteobacteria bacterium]|nr:IS256 family transposase [Pseudomonadota bacterium]